MSNYMSVYELNEEQLNELKSNWFLGYDRLLC